MPQPPGVPIAILAADAMCVGVTFYCQDCAARRRVGFDRLLPYLRRLRLDPATIGVRALCRHARRPCDGCGGTNFESRPDWRGMPGADGTAG